MHSTYIPTLTIKIQNTDVGILINQENKLTRVLSVYRYCRWAGSTSFVIFKASVWLKEFWAMFSKNQKYGKQGKGMLCLNSFGRILSNAQFFRTYLLHSLVEILVLCYNDIRCTKECNVINT